MSLDTSVQVRRGEGDALGEHPEIGGYRVVEGRHGTAIYGMVPVSDLLGLQQTWEAKGYTIWDIGVAQALGATIAATSEEGSKAWRAEVEALAAEKAGDDLELRWTLGCDTGRSAAVLLYVLGTSPSARTRNGGESTVERAVRRAQQEGEGDDA